MTDESFLKSTCLYGMCLHAFAGFIALYYIFHLAIVNSCVLFRLKMFILLLIHGPENHVDLLL